MNAADADGGRGRRRQDFLDSLQRSTNKDFYLWVEQLTVGDRPAAGRRLRAAIDQWLSSLDPDTEGAVEQRPRMTWSDEGWTTTVSAFPAGRDCRGREDHSIVGIVSDGGVQIVDHAPTLRKVVRKKAGAYGQLDAPLVIAVGTHILDHDHWHTTNTLYGELEIPLTEHDGALAADEARRVNSGLFTPPPPMLGKDVEGVLIVDGITPSSFHKARLDRWQNPAQKTTFLPLHRYLPITDWTPQEGQVIPHHSDIDPLGHIGLDSPWPQVEPFPRRE